MKIFIADKSAGLLFKRYLFLNSQHKIDRPIIGSGYNFQRLNAEDLAWFVGFVEGDGSFSVNKNGNYIKFEFTIKLSIRDIQL